jgi:hypothetical protein
MKATNSTHEKVVTYYIKRNGSEIKLASCNKGLSLDSLVKNNWYFFDPVKPQIYHYTWGLEFPGSHREKLTLTICFGIQDKPQTQYLHIVFPNIAEELKVYYEK